MYYTAKQNLDLLKTSKGISSLKPNGFEFFDVDNVREREVPVL